MTDKQLLERCNKIKELVCKDCQSDTCGLCRLFQFIEIVKLINKGTPLKSAHKKTAENVYHQMAQKQKDYDRRMYGELVTKQMV